MIKNSIIICLLVCIAVGSKVLQPILLAVAESVGTNNAVAAEWVNRLNQLFVLLFGMRPLCLVPGVEKSIVVSVAAAIPIPDDVELA